MAPRRHRGPPAQSDQLSSRRRGEAGMSSSGLIRHAAAEEARQGRRQAGHAQPVETLPTTLCMLPRPMRQSRRFKTTKRGRQGGGKRTGQQPAPRSPARKRVIADR
ncbi:hypothetical protein MRX96_019387 [Rhipicephalus microplus]